MRGRARSTYLLGCGLLGCGLLLGSSLLGRGSLFLGSRLLGRCDLLLRGGGGLLDLLLGNDGLLHLVGHLLLGGRLGSLLRELGAAGSALWLLEHALLNAGPQRLVEQGVEHGIRHGQVVVRLDILLQRLPAGGRVSRLNKSGLGEKHDRRRDKTYLEPLRSLS